MPSIIKAMGNPGKHAPMVLVIITLVMLAVSVIPVFAQDASTPVAPTPQPASSQPASPPTTPLTTPGADGAQIAQFTAQILAAMDGGPRVWQSADAVVPDFNQINAALASPNAKALDVRVAIWGDGQPGVNAEDVATSLGQSLGGTVIAIGPSSIGVYATTRSEAEVDQAVGEVGPTVAGEADPAVIITRIIDALSGQSNATSSGLMMPVVVGVAIILVGSGLWFGVGRGRFGARRGRSTKTNPMAPDDTNPDGQSPTPTTGASWGMRLNRFLAGDRSEEEAEASWPEEVGEAEALEEDDYPGNQGVRRVAAEVIGIESDAPANPTRTTPYQPVSTAASYGKVAARATIETIGQRIVALSRLVVQTNDMAIMEAFEHVAQQYTEAKTELDQAERPVDVINLNDKLAGIGEQLGVLERRITP